jgi:MoxR-like ATPase
MELRLAACLCRNASRPARHGAGARKVVYGLRPEAAAEQHMSLADVERNDGAVEQCLDELNDFIGALQRYSPTALAVALRVHLETLLQTLLEARICTPEEVRDFIRELEREALQYEED